MYESAGLLCLRAVCLAVAERETQSAVSGHPGAHGPVPHSLAAAQAAAEVGGTCVDPLRADASNTTQSYLFGRAHVWCCAPCYPLRVRMCVRMCVSECVCLCVRAHVCASRPYTVSQLDSTSGTQQTSDVLPDLPPDLRRNILWVTMARTMDSHSFLRVSFVQTGGGGAGGGIRLTYRDIVHHTPYDFLPWQRVV